MHEYDTVLKDLLQSPQSSILERITGVRIDHWLNVELPEVQQTRVDLLGETADRKRIIALELQSENDDAIPLRMAEYALRIYRAYQRFPEQYVLYVGNAKMRMASELKAKDFHCKYKLVDIRTVDAEALLESPFDSDGIIAVLARYTNKRETIRRILQRIAKLEGGARDVALRKLTILSGLRKLGDSVKAEVKHMPILDDIMDHDLLGPAIRQGIEKGREQGLEQGLEKGLQQGLKQGVQLGRLDVLKDQIQDRFGIVPSWAEEKLLELSAAELRRISVQILHASTLEELFNVSAR